MSRIGRQPVTIPSGVEVALGDDHVVTVKGPKGTLSRRLHPEIRVVVDGAELRVERPSDEGFHRGLHGLTRTLVANMVEGVTKGYEKRLSLVGVGYRAAMKGTALEIQVGFSHPVLVAAPEGIQFEAPNPTQLIVRGADKERVGQVAANIRSIRKPEPYKGKGIRYEDEQVRKKAGKAAKGAGA
ncbi:MAG: 50S ribosomal protein L6 [Actinomycetota bacterium]